MVFIVPLILKLLFVRYFISLSWYAHALSSYLCENRKTTHRTRMYSPDILPNTARATFFSASLSAVTVRVQNLVQMEVHETVIYYGSTASNDRSHCTQTWTLNLVENYSSIGMRSRDRDRLESLWKYAWNPWECTPFVKSETLQTRSRSDICNVAHRIRMSVYWYVNRIFIVHTCGVVDTREFLCSSISSKKLYGLCTCKRHHSLLWNSAIEYKILKKSITPQIVPLYDLVRVSR